MGKFKTYEPAIKDFCKANGINYADIETLACVWGIDYMELRDKHGETIMTVSGFDINNLQITVSDNYRLAALVDEYLEQEKALVMKQWKETGACLDGESDELKALKAEYYEKMLTRGNDFCNG